MEKLSRLVAFRQDIYDFVLSKRCDAQQELLDALMLSPPVRSFPELSLTPTMERQWHSLYKALEEGEQDTEALSSLLFGQLPTRLVRVYALDESAWPRPDAPTLEDRGFVHSATPTIDGAGIVVGHSYSTLAYCAEPDTSWTLPLSSRRVPTTSDAIEIGARQVKDLYRACSEKLGIDAVTGDGRYGNHRFLGALRRETERGNFGVLVRLRSDRVLFGEPGPYSGRGRPRKHGNVFRFKDPATWPDPEEYVSFTDARYGKVELRLWDGLHARDDAETVFSVLMARIHLEREKPPKSLWLAWRGPALPPEELWRCYQQRSSVEASFRFRKQYLAWTLPRLQTTRACERWTNLVTMAQWTLYLSRNVVRDCPQPWQRAQVRPTPERVKQGFACLFCEIGTPAGGPKSRGKSPGWLRGRPRSRRDRHPVVRKARGKAQKART